MEGDKMVREVLQDKSRAITALVGLPAWLEEMDLLHNQSSFDVFQVSERELQQLSGLSTPNQVIAYLEFWESTIDYSHLQQQFCFYLDGLQDPGNVGTILRIADWFGMPYVFGSMDTADFFSPKVVQSSMGAFMRVPSLRIELDQLLKLCQPIPVLGASMDGTNLFEGKWPGNGLVVLGREGSGLRDTAYQLLTHQVFIPGSGRAESLNAAVAGGILAANLIYGRSGL